MDHESNHESEQAPVGHRRHGEYLRACFAVGCFAGALASFFPRLMAIVAGNPGENVHVFSTAYLAVGCAIALIVGLVNLITNGDEERRLKDVFLSALGIPTLLMGTISTAATSANVVDLQQQMAHAVAGFQEAAAVPTRDTDASIPVDLAARPAVSGDAFDILVTPARAQGAYLRPPAPGAQNGMGISASQGNYIVVYENAPDARHLSALQAALHAKGITAQVQAGSRGDFLLVPADGAVKPYSEAVHAAVLAQAAGAHPYVVPVRN